MEGGSVDHVARVLRGEALYVAPGIAFIPYEYPPLYFYVCAAVAKIVGLGYAPLRAVSIASSLVCFGCIYAIVKRECASALAALVAAGLFAATFLIGGAWLDLARVDTLFLALFLLAVYVLRSSTTPLEHALAGMLFSLSFLTKQPALAMALPIVVHALVTNPRRGSWLAGTVIAACGIATLLLHAGTGGWFTFYVWWFPFQHEIVPSAWRTFWTRDMFAAIPIAFSVALLAAARPILRRSLSEAFWTAVFAGTIAGAYRSRVQTGGYDNVLLPAYASAAILAGMALAWCLERGRIVAMAACAACLLQFALLGYDPRPQIPGAVDRAAGGRLVSLLESIPGDALVPYHGRLSSAAGKRAHAHLMQVFDILKLGDVRSEALGRDFRSAIRRKDFGAIVLDDRSDYFFKSEVDSSYSLKSQIFSEPNVFYPRTGGMITRPQYLYVPK